MKINNILGLILALAIIVLGVGVGHKLELHGGFFVPLIILAVFVGSLASLIADMADNQ